MKITLNNKVRMAGKFVSQTNVICICQWLFSGINTAPISTDRQLVNDWLFMWVSLDILSFFSSILTKLWFCGFLGQI